jgi:hypothetical protein
MELIPIDIINIILSKFDNINDVYNLINAYDLDINYSTLMLNKNPYLFKEINEVLIYNKKLGLNRYIYLGVPTFGRFYITII